MPALARDFEVIDGRSARYRTVRKPAGGYDTGTLASDLAALMDALGHERFAVVGHDTGFAIGYALAADYPDRVDRVALAEIPGPPGAVPPPPLFVLGPCRYSRSAERRATVNTRVPGTAGRPENGGSGPAAPAVPRFFTLYLACTPCTASITHAAWVIDTCRREFSSQTTRWSGYFQVNTSGTR
jgi:pimeloyl-ACP methyl ester carboxylesterase